eukprot:m.1658347 g.1658347  ORF g.1658347 m.1658347 type:complete len:61 (-) comp116249_c0_seq1:55-237(-)
MCLDYVRLFFCNICHVQHGGGDCCQDTQHGAHDGYEGSCTPETHEISIKHTNTYMCVAFC